MSECECERKYGIPSGLLCGNPECLRTKRAEENIKRVFDKMFPKDEEKPDDRSL